MQQALPIFVECMDGRVGSALRCGRDLRNAVTIKAPAGRIDVTDPTLRGLWARAVPKLVIFVYHTAADTGHACAAAGSNEVAQEIAHQLVSQWNTLFADKENFAISAQYDTDQQLLAFEEKRVLPLPKVLARLLDELKYGQANTSPTLPVYHAEEGVMVGWQLAAQAPESGGKYFGISPVGDWEKALRLALTLLNDHGVRNPTVLLEPGLWVPTAVFENLPTIAPNVQWAT